MNIMGILDTLTGMGPAMLGAVSQGILWGIMALGVYITFRLLDIADLTVDGSFALGSCVCAVLIVNYNVNPFVALLVATLAAGLAGAVTGILHTICEIPAILAGILTQIALWSINLRVMGGKSNLPLLKADTIISGVSDSTGFTQSQASLVVGIIAAALVIALLYWFFGTEMGSALRATGNNEDMIRALGVDTRKAKLVALMLSNGLVGMSGAFICQQQRYADVGIGTGAIVVGLAAIVIGEVLMGRFRSFAHKLAAVVIGCVVYYLIRAVVLQFGLNPNDMKLFSAILVALALSTPVMMNKWNMKKAYSEEGEPEEC